MRARTFVLALAISVATIVLGIFSAGAFNPDDGFIAHVDPLWRVFGIAVYLGVLAIPVILLAGWVALVMHVLGRRHARRA